MPYHRRKSRARVSAEAKRLAALQKRLGLRPRQVRFVHLALANPDTSLSACYKDAGFADARHADEVWNNPKVITYRDAVVRTLQARHEARTSQEVKEVIEAPALVERALVSAGAVLDRLNSISQASAFDYIDLSPDGKSFEFNLSRAAKDPGLRLAVKNFKQDKETGAVIVELHDKVKCLEVLGRFLDMDKARPQGTVNMQWVQILKDHVPVEAMRKLYWDGHGTNGSNGHNGNGNGHDVGS